MPFLLTRANYEDLKVDARVIGSCPYRQGPRNGDWQPDLWAEQRRIRQMQPGEAMVTSGQSFDAKCGIITVPPIWEGGERKEALHLAACYDSALRLAHKRRCRSIAFPLLSGDCNGFPRDLALETAVETIGEFLKKHELMVYLSVKDAWARHLKKPEIPGLEDVPQEKILSPQEQFLAAISGGSKPQEPAPKSFPFLKPKAPASPEAKAFSQAVHEKMEAKNLKEPQLWQLANLDRQGFLKAAGGTAAPKKSAALAIAAALELSLPETEDLLKTAGLDLSGEEPFDLIVRYYLERGEYDISAINLTLFACDQPQLGET